MADHTERDHAIYSPSAAKRWLNCPGSIKLLEEMRSNGESSSSSSKAATRGTLCHMVAEMALNKKRFSVAKQVGKVSVVEGGEQTFFSSEMVEPVEKAVKEARLFMKMFPDADWSFEVKLEPLADMPNCWGTIDMLGIEMGKRVIVCDFKFGNGIVKETDNPQLMVYSLLASIPAFLDVDAGVGEFVGKIIQPVGNTQAKNWVTYPSTQLAEFKKEMQEAMKDESLHYSSEACQWCEAKQKCSAYTGNTSQKMAAAFDAVEVAPSVLPQSLPIPSEVKPEAVQHIMAFNKVYTKWFKEFMKVQQDKAIETEAFPGTKVVTGRKGNRKWVGTDEEIINHLTMFHAVQKKMIVKEQIVSVNQAEEVLNETAIRNLQQQGWIKQEDGKPTLALEDDKRKDYDITKLFSPVGA